MHSFEKEEKDASNKNDTNREVLFPLVNLHGLFT
jgi:hypothetical protein